MVHLLNQVCKKAGSFIIDSFRDSSRIWLAMQAMYPVKLKQSHCDHFSCIKKSWRGKEKLNLYEEWDWIHLL